ncbi:UNVERIFIED_CONTAM: hypothetical protein GTU68_049354 [Idotea baltica]|nr:hypothetical protein [Idotea baltica]
MTWDFLISVAMAAKYKHLILIGWRKTASDILKCTILPSAFPLGQLY